MTTEKKSEAGFEQDLEKLEAIVEALEEGGLPLEKSLKQFETGIQLARKCEKALRQAEQKIEMLVRGMDGEMEAQPFEQGEAQTETERPKPKKAGPKKAEPAPAAEAPVEEEPPDSVYDDEDEDMDALF